jgi:hypothetical protein
MRPVDLDQGQEEDTERAQKKTLDTGRRLAVVLCTVVRTHMTRVTPNNPTKDLHIRAATIPTRVMITITRHRHPWADTVIRYLLRREILV